MVRLGLYVDGPYALAPDATGAQRLWCDAADLPFLTYACAVGEHFDHRAVFARVQRREPGAGDPLPADLRVVPLPDFGDLRQTGKLVRAALGTVRGFWSGLRHVDVVWVFGPHPFSVLLVLLALLRRKRVVLGVRQDTVAYFEARASHGSPLVARVTRVVVSALDLTYRWLARVTAATVVGEELARRFGAPSARVLPMTVTLMSEDDLATAPRAPEDGGAIRLLTVGRVDREKNPLLLVDAMAELDRQDPGRWHLTWVGAGPMRDDVLGHARARGVQGCVELPGFVPFGPELVAHYRRADVFVHVSLTEGVPAVLVEAMANGVPVVATAVGGVATALDGGAAGLLVPPSDLAALVDAIRRVACDPEHARTLATRGLRIARAHTIEAESARVARFLRGSSWQRRP